MFDELKKLAEKTNSNEIWLWLANAGFNWLKTLIKNPQLFDEARSVFDELKKSAEKIKSNEIWLDLAIMSGGYYSVSKDTSYRDSAVKSLNCILDNLKNNDLSVLFETQASLQEFYNNLHAKLSLFENIPECDEVLYKLRGFFRDLRE